MSGRKRRDTQDHGDIRGKSARASKAPPPLGLGRSPVSPPSAAGPSFRRFGELSNNITIHIEETNNAVAECNRVLDFLQPSQLADLDVQRSHAAFLRGEAARTIQQAEDQLSQLQATLHSTQYDMLAGAAAESIHWYQQADLLSLNYTLLSAVFDKYPIQDAADFNEYLCRVVPSSLKRPLDVGQVRGGKQRDRRCQLRAEALEKIFLFRRALLESPDPQALRYRVYFSVFMITSILPRSCWGEVWDPEVREEHGASRDRVQWYWQTPTLYQRCKDLFCYLDGILTPPESDQDDWWTLPREEFLDAAAMYRRCFSEYSSHRCSYSEHAYGERDLSQDQERNAYYLWDDGDTRCFHQHIVRLLRALLRHARREIRQRTLIAAGARLPVELTDIASEYALQAEGIPSFEDILYRPTNIHGPTSTLRPEYQVCIWTSSLPWHCEQRSYTTIICDYKDWTKPPDYRRLEPPDYGAARPWWSEAASLG